MSPDELTCCLLYLSKIGLDPSNPELQIIINECIRRVNDENTISLPALSRYTVAVNSINGGFFLCLVCKDSLPKILEYLKKCDNSEDLRLITICLSHLHKLVTTDIMNMYVEKVNELLERNVINAETVRSILKVVNFLNYPQWSQENIKIIRKLILLVNNNIDKFQTRELVAMFKVFQSHLEPADLVHATTKQSQILLEKTPCAELLTCAVLYSLPERRRAMTEIANKIMFSTETHTMRTLPALFKVLRLLKISNLNLCDAYWSRVLEEIQSYTDEQKSYRISRHCHRYMHFNNNLGGTYRYYPFEKYVTDVIMKEIEFGISNLIPIRFAKLSSFVLAYGHTSRGRIMFPDFIISKLEAMKEQFTINDCLQISRGLQIALQMRFKYFIPREMGAQLSRIENILNDCAERHLNGNSLSLVDINCIIRTFNNRKCKSF